MNRRKFLATSAAALLFQGQTEAALAQTGRQAEWVEIGRRRLSPNARRAIFDLKTHAAKIEHIRFSATGNAVWLDEVSLISSAKPLVPPEVTGRNIPPGRFSGTRKLPPGTRQVVANIVLHPLSNDMTELVLWGQC